MTAVLMDSLSAAVSILAFTASVRALCRIKDRRICALSFLLSLLAIDRILNLLHHYTEWGIVGWNSGPEIRSLIVSVVALLAVFFVTRMVIDHLGARRQSSIEKAYFEGLFEGAPEAVVVLDNNDCVVRANGEFCETFGYRSEETTGRRINDLIVPDHLRNEGLALTNKVLRGEKVKHETVRQRKDGTLVHVSILSKPIEDETGQMAVYGIYRDITARKKAEEALAHRALHDALTGLPNRALFMDRLDHSLSRHVRSHKAMPAVLFLDLDRFKLVNDSLGHAAGDKLLVAVSARLQQCLRPGDTVSRIGGDEFALLLDSIEDVSDATGIADRIHKDLSVPFLVDGHETFTTASIGIAIGGSHYSRPEDLLRDADTALYRAKALGTGQNEVFDATMRSRAVEILRVQNDLRRAVEKEEFRVVYQPIVSLDNGEITGFEALVRWQHPERGLLAPAQFIEVAEETGVIVQIGQWVLHEACRQARTWHDAGRKVAMSVNLSAKQFQRTDIAGCVVDALRESRLPAKYLHLEITETVLMGDAEGLVELVRKLKNLGVQVHIDDFGTGYSSLSYLQRFQVDALKIDRSFVKDMAVNGGERAIVETIASLGHNLGIEVIAEGVETPMQLSMLEGMNCTHAQGYYFCTPVGSDDATELLDSAWQGAAAVA